MASEDGEQDSLWFDGISLAEMVWDYVYAPREATERMAMAAMQGMLAHGGMMDPTVLAEAAVRCAEALRMQLDVADHERRQAEKQRRMEALRSAKG